MKYKSEFAMTSKHFLTLATICNLYYGLWYFLSPLGAAIVKGFCASSTSLDGLIKH